MNNTYPEGCLNCHSENIYKNHVKATGGLLSGASLLPDLGSTEWSPKLRIIVCADCGFTQFYADSKSRARVAEKWARILD